MMGWHLIMLHHLWNLTSTAPELSRSDYFLGLYLVAVNWTLAATSFSSCLQPFSRAWHPWGLTCAVVCNGMCACLVMRTIKFESSPSHLESISHKPFWYLAVAYAILLSCANDFLHLLYVTSICILSTWLRSHVSYIWCSCIFITVFDFRRYYRQLKTKLDFKA